MITESEMKDAYIKPSRGRFQVCIKHVHIYTVCFGVHHRGNEPANVELSFNELWVSGKGLFNTRVSPRWFLHSRHGGAATKRRATYGPESKGPIIPSFYAKTKYSSYA
jgi:hypothetical protein